MKKITILISLALAGVITAQDAALTEKDVPKKVVAARNKKAARLSKIRKQRGARMLQVSLLQSSKSAATLPKKPHPTRPSRRASKKMAAG
jgi:hypothetical protein